MQSGTQQERLAWNLGEKGAFKNGLEQWGKLHAAHGLPVLTNAVSLKIALAHFGKGDERFAYGSLNGELVSMTVLQSVSKGKYRLFQPEQVPLSFYNGPTTRDIMLDLRALLDSLPIWALALAINVLDERVFSFQSSYLACRIVPKFQTAFIDLSETLAEYVASLSPRFLHDLRRRTRKAEAEVGALSFTLARAPGEMPALVDLYGDMESAGWKSQTGTAVVREGYQAKFYSEWLTALAKEGHAAVFSLNIGDKPAAMRLCAFDKSALYILKVSHNESLKVYGPGALHMNQLIQQIYAQDGLLPKRIEYYGKLAESQKQWMTGSRPIQHATAYRSRALIKILELVWPRHSDLTARTQAESIKTVETAA